MYYEQKQEFFKNFKKYDAYVEDRINSGIEQNRKGWGEITVVDSDGNPVKDAKITLSQKSHEFKYGCNLFMLDEFETEEKNRLYKEYVKGVFNMTTLPFYWSAVEPEQGKPRYAKDSPKIYRRPAIDLCMEFCEENGIEPREHGLAYPAFFPKWLHDADVSTIKKHFERRCKEISERYGDKINTIEVTNEMFWPVGRFFKSYKDHDFVSWMFKIAEKYFPHNQLVINEGNGTWANSKTQWAYFDIIRNAMASGARIDAIGLQYHMFFKEDAALKSTEIFYNPSNLYEKLDWYAKFGKPIQITEVTIPAYSEHPENEKLQAEILERLFKIWFSHPNVEQIIYWNLVDGYANGAKHGDMTKGENIYYGGLLRFDMTPKPAYYTVKNLFEKEWHTEAEAKTDAEGFALFKGFYGDYAVKVEVNGKVTEKEITLGKRLLNVYKFEI